MTSEERLDLIKNLAKAGKKAKKRGRPAKAKVQSDFVPLEPTAPSENDIREEIEFLTQYKAENYINYEQD